MAFTEQDMKRQAETIAALKEELSRLASVEKNLRQAANMSETDTGPVDYAHISPEARAQMKQFEAEAKRAGEARATQLTTSACTSKASLTSMARRSALRA